MDPIRFVFAKAGAGVLYWDDPHGLHSAPYFRLIQLLMEAEPPGRRPFLAAAFRSWLSQQDLQSLQGYDDYLQKPNTATTEQCIQALADAGYADEGLLAYLTAVASCDGGIISPQAWAWLMRCAECLGVRRTWMQELCSRQSFEEPIYAAIYMSVRLIQESAMLDEHTVELIRRRLKNRGLSLPTQHAFLRFCTEIEQARVIAVARVNEIASTDKSQAEALAELLLEPVKHYTGSDLNAQYCRELIRNNLTQELDGEIAERIREWMEPHMPLDKMNDLDRDCAEFGKSRNATWDEIRDAYHRFSLQFHPDKLQSKDIPQPIVTFGLERFKKVSAAYSRLRKYFSEQPANPYYTPPPDETSTGEKRYAVSF